jgi:hypothetical protein
MHSPLCTAAQPSGQMTVARGFAASERQAPDPHQTAPAQTSSHSLPALCKLDPAALKIIAARYRRSPQTPSLSLARHDRPVGEGRIVQLFGTFPSSIAHKRLSLH